MKQLREVGRRAEVALQAASKGNLSAEQQKRIDQLLAAMRNPKIKLGEVRAVHVLERIGTPESKKLLEELAKGAETAPSTRKAQNALGRKH